MVFPYAQIYLAGDGGQRRIATRNFGPWVDGDVLFHSGMPDEKWQQLQVHDPAYRVHSGAGGGSVARVASVTHPSLGLYSAPMDVRGSHSIVLEGIVYHYRGSQASIPLDEIEGDWPVYELGWVFASSAGEEWLCITRQRFFWDGRSFVVTILGAEPRGEAVMADNPYSHDRQRDPLLLRLKNGSRLYVPAPWMSEDVPARRGPHWNTTPLMDVTGNFTADIDPDGAVVRLHARPTTVPAG